MKIIIYLILTIFSLTFSFSDAIKFASEEKDVSYYYCAILEGGIDFKILNPINSLSDFTREKKFLEKIFPKRDANYYKLITKKHQNILYGYSMRTNKLKELIKLDENGRLKYKKTYQYDLNQTKECFWKYETNNKILISSEICDDDSKNTTYLNYDEKWKTYIKEQELRYRHDKLVHKYIHDTSYSTVDVYDSNNTLIHTWNTIGESDLCTPFFSYDINVTEDVK